MGRFAVKPSRHHSHPLNGGASVTPMPVAGEGRVRCRRITVRDHEQSDSRLHCTSRQLEHPGAARVGIGGPVGSGKTALLEQLIPRFIRRGTNLAVITNDLVTQGGRRAREAQRPDRSGAGHGGGDRRLPAYGDPGRSDLEHPGRGRAGGEVRPARPGADRKRRRQPRLDLLAGPGRLLAVRDRHRRRRRHPAQAGPGDRAVATSW